MKPSISANAPSSEGGGLSYAQSEDRFQATKLPTRGEDRDRDRLKSRFKEHPAPKVRRASKQDSRKT